MPYPLEVLENFDNLNRWTQKPATGGVVLSENKITGNNTGYSNIYMDVEETDIFRFEAIVKLNSVPDARGLFMAVSTGGYGTDHATDGRWRAIGFENGQGGINYMDGPSSVRTRIKDTAALTLDGTKKYIFQMIGFGGGIHATVSDVDGSNPKTIFIPNALAGFKVKGICLRIYDTNDSIEKVSFKSAILRYSNPTFNKKMYLAPVVNGQPNFIALPADYNNDVRKVALCFHGHTSTAATWADNVRYGPATQTLANDGYIVAASDNHGNSWGSVPGVEDGMHTINWLKANFKIEDKVRILGNSMGGLNALLFTADYPDVVKSVVLTAPAISLTLAYPAFATAINAAYGCTKATMADMTKGRSPHMRAKEYIPFSIKIWHALDDETIPYGTSKDFANTVNGYGGNVELIDIPSGGHANNAIWDYPEIVEFFNTAKAPVQGKRINFYKTIDYKI